VKWKRRIRSDDLIDRRGRSGGFGRGGGIPIPLGALGKMGIPGLIILGVILFLNLSGGNGIDGGADNLERPDGSAASDPLDPDQRS
jgi:predicted metalloprotease